MKHIRITCFGDSICAGEGVALHNGWIPRLSKYLSKVGEKHGAMVTLTNSSINGETTRQALLRIAYHVTTKECDILLIQFGMNDCNRWENENEVYRVSPESFKANIKEMLYRAHVAKIPQVIVNTNHSSTRQINNYPHSILQYNDLIREAVTSYNACPVKKSVTLLDVARGIGAKSCKAQDLVLLDGIHLSKQGHDVYFSIVKPVLTNSVLNLL